MPVARFRPRRPVFALSVMLVAALAASAALAGSSDALTASPHNETATLAANDCDRSAIDVPDCGVLWGLYRPRVPVAGQSAWSAHYEDVEQQIGRRFDLVKNYVDWRAGDTFPAGPDKTLAAGGRTLYFSWTATNFKSNAKISYASIADGEWDDSVLIPEAQHLKAFSGKVFIDFNHEPDAAAQDGHGTAAEYVAAYRHIHDVFAAAGVTNVIWSWVTTGYLGNAATIRADYPGSNYVDWIGWDPYNLGSCAGWQWVAPYDLFDEFYAWVEKQPDMNTKPLMLAEYAASFEPGVQSWYASVASALQQLPKIKAVMQFSGPTAGGCDVQLTDSAAAMAGFKTSANAPYVMGTGSATSRSV